MHQGWRRGILGILICHMTIVTGYAATWFFQAKFLVLAKEQTQIEARSNQAVAQRNVKAMTQTTDELESVYLRMKPLRNVILGVAAVLIVASVIHAWAVWQLTLGFTSQIEGIARVAALLAPALMALRMLVPQNESLRSLPLFAGVLTYNGIFVAIARICRQIDSPEIAKSLRNILWVWVAAFVFHDVVARQMGGIVGIATLWGIACWGVFYSMTLLKLWQRAGFHGESA